MHRTHCCMYTGSLLKKTRGIQLPALPCRAWYKSPDQSIQTKARNSFGDARFIGALWFRLLLNHTGFVHRNAVILIFWGRFHAIILTVTNSRRICPAPCNSLTVYHCATANLPICHRWNISVGSRSVLGTHVPSSSGQLAQIPQCHCTTKVKERTRCCARYMHHAVT